MRTATFTPAWVDACALWRLFIPHLNLPHSRFVFRQGGSALEEFSSTDVIVVQRQCTEANLQALQAIKSMGLKIVYDLDDNMWSLPAANPAKRIFDNLRDGFANCAAAADVLTVSTEPLRSAVRTAVPSLGKEIVVVPNAIDFNLFRGKLAKRQEGKVVVGWGGSNSHGADLKDAWDALPEAMEAEPTMHLEVVGMPPPKKLIGHPRLRERAWVPIAEYPARWASWGWDIVLAPLEDNRFNRSKSNIKMLEAAAIGAPCLVSPVQAYSDFCVKEKGLAYLLCRSRTQWLDKIVELVRNPGLREVLAKGVREVAEAEFSITTVIDKWSEVIENC